VAKLNKPDVIFLAMEAVARLAGKGLGPFLRPLPFGALGSVEPYPIEIRVVVSDFYSWEDVTLPAFYKAVDALGAWIAGAKPVGFVVPDPIAMSWRQAEGVTDPSSGIALVVSYDYDAPTARAFITLSARVVGARVEDGWAKGKAIVLEPLPMGQLREIALEG
jgi:hypothetical protein